MYQGLILNRYRNRALLLKRHGDAHTRSPTAHATFSHLPHDHLKGLLCLTDSILLWLWAHFCEEQFWGGRKASLYDGSSALRDFVRKGWESIIKSMTDEAEKDRARAMVGLL